MIDQDTRRSVHGDTLSADPTLPQIDLTLTVNGARWSGAVPVEETLLEFVRSRLGLTGTKRSCESLSSTMSQWLVIPEPLT